MSEQVSGNAGRTGGTWRAALIVLLLAALVSPLLPGGSTCPCCAVWVAEMETSPPAGQATVWPYLLVTALPFLGALIVSLLLSATRRGPARL